MGKRNISSTFNYMKSAFNSHLFFFAFFMINVAAQTSITTNNFLTKTEVIEGGVPASLDPLLSVASSYLVRCKFALDLKSNLQADEIEALLTFIQSDPEDVGLSRGHFNSVGDKVIGALERQNTIPPALVDVLIEMFRDQEGSFTWRDYCVQHLGSLYATDAAIGKRDHIRQVWDEAIKPDVRMSGTVVLALRNNVGQEGVSREYAADMAGEVALDDDQPDSSRLTAIQVAAELGNQEMLPLARSVVPPKEYTIPFRMSAMATIGILGNTSDLPLLKQYINSSDMRLRLASRAAVEKIEKRYTTE